MIFQIKRLFNTDRFNLIFLITIAVIIHLPLYHSPYWRTDDAIQYINVARNLVSGQGFVQNTKSDYATSYPAITSSFHGRTSLFSLFLAAIYFLNGDEYTMQLFSFVISIINACLVYKLCRRWVSPKWSFVSGLLAALNPNLLINSRLILTEPLFTMFILLTFITIYYMKDRLIKYCIIGGLISLTYLTRAEGLLLLPLLAITSVTVPNRNLKTVLLIVSFLVVTAPYFYGNFINTGNPLYSINQRLYSVHDYTEYVNGNGYGVIFPSPFEFIKNNFFWIVQKEVTVFRDNINSLIYFDWLGPLVIFIILVFLPSTWKKFNNFYIYAFIIVLVYSSAWSALFERSRHFTSTYLLLLIPLAFAFEKLAKRHMNLVLVILASVIIPYLILDVHRTIWSQTVETLAKEDVGPIKREKEFAWIKKNIRKDDIISSTNPEMIYLFTERSGILTPIVLNKKNYLTYVHQYHVKYFITDGPNKDVFLKHLADLKATFQGNDIYEVRKK